MKATQRFTISSKILIYRIEDANFALFNYVTEMNNQVETLQDSIAKLKQDIKVNFWLIICLFINYHPSSKVLECLSIYLFVCSLATTIRVNTFGFKFDGRNPLVQRWF